MMALKKQKLATRDAKSTKTGKNTVEMSHKSSNSKPLKQTKQSNQSKSQSQESKPKKEQASKEKGSNEVSKKKALKEGSSRASTAKTETTSSSEDSEKELESSDSELEDDLEVQQESDQEVEELSSSSDESDDDSFPLRKKKQDTDSGKESFANAFNAIVGSKLKAYDRKDPILARNKTTHKKLEAEKLEAKARRLIRAEKKEEQDKQRIKHLLPKDASKIREALEFERKMKKVAQRGVVKLFNVILATQMTTSKELASGSISESKDPESFNEMTKLTFLDLVKAAGQE